MAGVRTFQVILRLGSDTSVASGPINRLAQVGRRILQLRKSWGWNQVELAEKAGLHYVSLGRIEKGKANVSVLSLSKIADALGVRIADLLTLSGEESTIAVNPDADAGGRFVLKLLGKCVFKLREQKGWSQKELAKRTELHPITISRIENGQRNITLLDALKIAEVLEVEVGELLRSKPAEIS